MEIKYLKKLKNNPTINRRTIKGISEDAIKKVEKKLNIKFPDAYKEFLFLAGDYTGGLRLAEGNSSIDILVKDDVRKRLEKSMEEFQIPINKPFWAISEKDGFQQFFFFYLHEGTENPSVWFTTYGEGDDDPNVLIKLNDTFSQFIDELIDRSILFAQRGY
ncbi:SMI1/KNR4 family protein [Chryseobacterium vrystaatense]|uniref:SMI1 / KNR4 family (SUKH-1) n=1 Tax=Chryseobacterium vrystaatense TaxID=307480 RepID=A0A1M4V9Q8_9FLAO|nr:SMI1/KNR4 family protein [Chryseobacterium vrystaatense]KFF28066.1 hypothetical protein IW16_02295 [Chryseobacterium vrystaatense]SHE65709.1 SMI1 / KNR4 family (SUKH-1) [Chryseobacterium vrystaatense]